MPSHTKTLGPAARFGARYGKGIRDKVKEIEIQYKHRRLKCPFCNYKAVKRVAYGIWKCNKCGKVFAGKAYSPY